jgi:hypothetical protein
VPVKEFNRDWRSALIHHLDQVPQDIGAYDVRNQMNQYGWVFELTADIDDDGNQEKVGVGVYATAEGARGTFMIVIGAVGVKFLEVTNPGKAGFGVVRFNEKGIEYAGCLGCGDLRWYTFTDAQEAAACVVPVQKIQKVSDTQARYLAEPTVARAEEFLANLPEDFCRFRFVYGYDEYEGAGSLYSGPDFERVLALLAEHIPPEKLMGKYVSYAVNANWEADNVSFLQQAYRNFAARNPRILIDVMRSYERDQKMNAFAFLYDGPHPESHRKEAEAFVADVCALNSVACDEIQLAWTYLLERDHH